VIHKDIISLCVHTEKTGNVESYGTGVCCMFRVGRDCDMYRTVLGEKLNAYIEGEGDSIGCSGDKVKEWEGAGYLLQKYVQNGIRDLD